jgi:hypothetical protein
MLLVCLANGRALIVRAACPTAADNLWRNAQLCNAGISHEKRVIKPKVAAVFLSNEGFNYGGIGWFIVTPSEDAGSRHTAWKVLAK